MSAIYCVFLFFFADQPPHNSDIMIEDHMDIDGEMMMMNDVPEIDTNVPHTQTCSQIPESQNTQAEEVISQIYEGAPQEVR